MDYIAVAALAVFGLTLFLMIKRPFGLRLGYAASIGAAASLLMGTVTLGQAAHAFLEIWDAALAFIGIVALSVILDAMGFFRWAALRVVRLARGSGLRLYFYVSLLTATVSVLFANDSAVLILTPIVLEIIWQLKIDGKGRYAYLFPAGLIADTAAMPLITSNPINILNANFFGYTFIDHLVFMGPIALATITISMFLVYLFFRKRIPKTYDVKLVDTLCASSKTIEPKMLRIRLGTLVTINLGYIIGSLSLVPVSLVVCAGVFFLLMAYLGGLNREIKRGELKGLRELAKDINWDIVLFMLSIFIVVNGLINAGIMDFLVFAFTSTTTLPSFLSILAPSLILTVGASFMNN